MVPFLAHFQTALCCELDRIWAIVPQQWATLSVTTACKVQQQQQTKCPHWSSTIANFHAFIFYFLVVAWIDEFAYSVSVAKCVRLFEKCCALLAGTATTFPYKRLYKSIECCCQQLPFSLSPFLRLGVGVRGVVVVVVVAVAVFLLPPEPLPQSALPLAVAAFWRFSELKERKWERETSVQLRFDGKGKKRLSSTHTFDTLSDLLTLSDKTVWFQWH